MSANDEAIVDLVERIYTDVDLLLRAGRFGKVNDRLRFADVDTLPVWALLAWASITSAAHERLPARASFMARLRARLERDRPEDAEELLRGLDIGPPPGAVLGSAV